MKFFVSYSRSLKTEVGEIIDLLRKAGNEVWWDGDIPVIADWWATILHEIEQCSVMLFMISEKSVQSPYCLDELHYAIERNRPVLPFIMDDHSKYKDAFPKELGRRQWYVHDGNLANMLARINKDCAQIIWTHHQDRPAPRPPEPNSGGRTLTKQFQQAVILAEEGKFEQAIAGFNNVANLDYGEWGTDCQQWIVRIQRYTVIADLADHKVTLGKARTKWQSHLQDDPEAADFDPLLVIPKMASIVNPPSSPAVSARDRLLKLLPTPFDLLPIPAGSVTLGGKNGVNGGYIKQATFFDVPAFSIAKYSVTNAQYRNFIDAGGYSNQRWWTDDGWQVRGENSWTEPRYWQDKEWNGANHPVVGVSWYEATAFCRWLRETTGENIILPTEQQWQRAAQDDDGRAYPWGNDWDCNRCNNSVKPCDSNKTTPVTHYEGKNKGDSPFGVVDMAGNVWEWCLTEYDTGSIDENGTNVRMLRGGSWFLNNTVNFRVDYRIRSSPNGWDDSRGFRFALSS